MQLRPARRRRFTTSMAAISTVVVIVLLLYNAWFNYGAMRYILDTDLELSRSSGRLMLLDEVLTMSARMAVATRDREWVARYLKAKGEVNEALAFARSITPRSLMPELERTAAANADMLALQARAMTLLEQGLPSEADEVLSGGEYQKFRMQYVSGMERTIDGIQEHTRTESRRVKIWTDIATIAAAAGIAVSFVLMAADSRRQRREYVLREELAVLARRNAVERLAIGITHEISQPLSAIGHYLDGAQTMLAAPERTVPGRVQEALQGAREQAVRAGMIVQRMREFGGRGAKQRETLEIGAIIREIEVLLRPHARQAGVEFIIEWAEREIWVHGDRVSIQQVMVNLVLNAVQACSEMPGSRRVTLRASGGDGVARVWVQDTGNGVKPEEAESIFEAFYSSKPGGLGLGLPISRDIVESHGGALTLGPSESGACFVIELPRVSP